MRPMRLLAALAASVALFAPAAAQAEPAELLDLFEQVCLDGGVQARQDALQSVHLRDLPQDARRALQLLSPEFQGRDALRLFRATAGSVAISSEHVPNRIYRISGTSAYLLTPAAASSAQGLGGQCILVWEGRDFDAAGRAMRRWLGAAGDPPRPVEPANFGWQDSPVMTAASLRDWTLLRALPAGSQQ